MLNPNNTNDKTKEKELKGEKKKIADLTSKLTKVQNYSDLVECLEELRKIANERSQFINFISLTRSKKKGMYGCKTILNKEFGNNGENKDQIKNDPSKLIQICAKISEVLKNTKRSVLNGDFCKAMGEALSNIASNINKNCEEEMQKIVEDVCTECLKETFKLLEEESKKGQDKQAKNELVLLKDKLKTKPENFNAKNPEQLKKIIINQTKENEKIVNNMSNVNEDTKAKIINEMEEGKEKSIKKIKKWDVSKHWKFTNWVTGHGWKNK